MEYVSLRHGPDKHRHIEKSDYRRMAAEAGMKIQSITAQAEKIGLPIIPLTPISMETFGQTGVYSCCVFADGSMLPL